MADPSMNVYKIHMKTPVPKSLFNKVAGSDLELY